MEIRFRKRTPPPHTLSSLYLPRVSYVDTELRKSKEDVSTVTGPLGPERPNITESAQTPVDTFMVKLGFGLRDPVLNT